MKTSPGDDLAMLLTPPGVAALAVVRVHGCRAVTAVAARLSRPPRRNRPVYATLSDTQGVVIDDLVAVIAEDESYLDLTLHGGAWVVEATLRLMRSLGIEVVEWRCATNHAMAPLSLVDSAIAASLPLATTPLGAEALLHQATAWEELFRAHRLDIESDWERVWTDRRWRDESAPSLAGAIRTLATDRTLWRLLHPALVAIVGPANVGKSTLVNRLLARERSIVADVAGTTRDWVGETVDLRGVPLVLIDTPGARETPDRLERDAIALSQGVIRSADVVAVVLDRSRPLDAEQRAALLAYPDAIVLANKSDLAPAWELTVAGGLGISAARGEGIDPLVDAILARLGFAAFEATEPRLWTEAQFASAGDDQLP